MKQVKHWAIKQLLLAFVIVPTFCSLAIAEVPKLERLLMSMPTEVLSADDFENDTVADRWGFRAFYTVKNGALTRTSHKAREVSRSFLKDVVFRDAIIQFDFRFEGAAEIRLMTGGGGGYNTVTQIFPNYFQVNTAKRKEEFNPSCQGECAFSFKKGDWYTMTIEFVGDEVVAHVDGEHFVVGRHPIIDTERTYLAFQVSGGMASFDNFSLREAKAEPNWIAKRAKYLAEQNSRGPAFTRNAKEEYDLIYLNLKDRLQRNDSKYRQLVNQVAELEKKMKSEFSAANQTHKELSKSVSVTKKELKKTNPRFKKLEHDLNQSRKVIRDYVHSLFPELDDLPKQTYYWKYEKCLAELANDPDLVKYVSESLRLENTLHESFPAAFQDIDELVDRRKLVQTRLKSDDDYRALKKQIAEAKRAVDAYLFQAEPKLSELSDARMELIKSGN
ncbi:MAG: DUF1080 domain-containing protein [Planctomycetaceae bacterium]|nr:DUF1080 domain-containing protein [Planctomycetaceae bacterium]